MLLNSIFWADDLILLSEDEKGLNSLLKILEKYCSQNEIEINSFHIPSSTEWNPLGNFKANVYFDVEGYVDKKIQALKCYDKEMRKYPHPRSYESVMNNLRTNGNEVGLNYCEKFQIIRKVLL